MKLDAYDRKILAALQRDGRLSNVQLADEIGLSASPCLRRVRMLEEAGVIRGYQANLDGDADVMVLPLIVPTLCVGMQPGSLLVPSEAERGASVEAFPRRAWERS